MSEKVAFVAHGFADDYFTPWWRPVREKFEYWGYDVIEINFDGLARTIDSPRLYAERVEAKIDAMYDELEDEYEGAEIVIVGHSMGGMVARYFIERLGYEDEVDKLITFGSPHQGTLVAVPFALPLIGPKGAVDLSPGSSFLESLNRDGLSEQVDYAAVYTTNDPLVVPRKNGALPNPKEGDMNIRVGRSVLEILFDSAELGGGGYPRRDDLLTGHVTIFYNDDTWEGVAEFLGEDDAGATVEDEILEDMKDDLRWTADKIVERTRRFVGRSISRR